MPIPYRDQLNLINTSYLRETDLKLLHGELVSLDALLAYPRLSDENREMGTALRLRLDSKICFLTYVNGGFNDADYTEALEHYASNLAQAQERKYANSVQLIEELKRFTVNLCGIVKEAWQQRKLFQASSATVVDGAMCDRAIQTVERAKELLEVCNLTVSTPYLELGEVKQITLNFLQQCNTLFVETRQKLLARIISTSVKDLEEYKNNMYFPLPENDEGGKANTLVLSTPLIDDARLFAVNQCDNGRKLLCVSVYSLTDKSADFFKMLFNY